MTLITTLDKLTDATTDTMAEDARPLSFAEYAAGERIAVAEDLSVLDGYHRVAGLQAWAIAEGFDFAAIHLEVTVYADGPAFERLLDMGGGEDRESVLGELYAG